MTYTYRNITNIKFPIYALPNDNWQCVDGLLFLDNQILDDTNVKGESLGLRRLKTPFKSLFPLKKGSMELQFLLKHKHFIDSHGTVFTYEKTRFHELNYYKIKSVELKETGSLVWFYGVSFPFELPRPPPDKAAYARILHLNKIPWLIYDFAFEKGKDTRRMV